MAKRLSTVPDEAFPSRNLLVRIRFVFILSEINEGKFDFDIEPIVASAKEKFVWAEFLIDVTSLSYLLIMPITS